MNKKGRKVRIKHRKAKERVKRRTKAVKAAAKRA